MVLYPFIMGGGSYAIWAGKTFQILGMKIRDVIESNRFSLSTLITPEEMGKGKGCKQPDPSMHCPARAGPALFFEEKGNE